MILGAFGSGRANRIDDHLWQGGYPLAGLRSEDIDVVVLCARELQPEDDRNLFPGNVEVICAPMDDEPGGPSAEDARTAFNTASKVVDRLAQGKNVLVTCVAGRNRSGLVNALVLVMKDGVSGVEATSRIQFARKLALTNPDFVTFLSKIPAHTAGF